MTAAIVKRIDADKVRAEIHEITGRLRNIKDEAEHKLVRLAVLTLLVREHKLFRQWKDPATRKPYLNFDQWLKAEISESRSSVYRLMDVRTNLKALSDEELEKIGNMRCFELAKVAREKPSLLSRFVKTIEKNPELPLYTLQQMVTNTLADGHFDSGKYERFEFAVRIEDSPMVMKAMAVLQTTDAVKAPETAAGRGMHLVSLCQEFLSDKHNVKILKGLEEAGAFSKSAFKLE